MKIIITMGGLSKRFKNVGINIPKYKIHVNGKTIFEWSLLSLKDLFNEHFIFIHNEDNIDFLVETISKLKIKKYDFINLTKQTSGQAETAIMAEKFFSVDDSFLIHNIDTYIMNSNISYFDFNRGYNLVYTTYAPGDNWSFFKTDENLNVIQVTEKVRISDNASLGLYYFNSFGLFKNIFHKYKKRVINQYGETYVAPFYEFLLGIETLKIKHIDSKNVVFLGTPEEVELFKLRGK